MFRLISRRFSVTNYTLSTPSDKLCGILVEEEMKCHTFWYFSTAGIHGIKVSTGYRSTGGDKVLWAYSIGTYFIQSQVNSVLFH
jgi:hypothetical protein